MRPMKRAAPAALGAVPGRWSDQYAGVGHHRRRRVSLALKQPRRVTPAVERALHRRPPVSHPVDRPFTGFLPSSMDWIEYHIVDTSINVFFSCLLLENQRVPSFNGVSSSVLLGSFIGRVIHWHASPNLLGSHLDVEWITSSLTQLWTGMIPRVQRRHGRVLPAVPGVVNQPPEPACRPLPAG